jgi:drug/metabolite transporter (DMT)-like permease
MAASARLGWVLGGIGVVIFSGSLPATRLAVLGIDPATVTALRAAGAGVLALLILVGLAPRWPTRREVRGLVVVAGGVILGFPLCSALALRSMDAAQGTIILGVMPAITALFGVVLAGERPRPAFWGYVALGVLTVAAQGALSGGVALGWGTPILSLGVVVCALGYAEGARVGRSLGGWLVICWALVLALPVTLPWALWSLAGNAGALGRADASALAGLAYVTLFSMLIGFFFWYGGLALGGIAAVSQIQLLQAFLSLLASALVLGERVDPPMVAAACVLLLCALGAKRHAVARAA